MSPAMKGHAWVDFPPVLWQAADTQTVWCSRTSPALERTCRPMELGVPLTDVTIIWPIATTGEKHIQEPELHSPPSPQGSALKDAAELGSEKAMLKAHGRQRSGLDLRVAWKGPAHLQTPAAPFLWLSFRREISVSEREAYELRVNPV